MKIHLYALSWNDADMLPFFFRHYDRFVSRYYIFDDGSTDESLAIMQSRQNVEVREFVREDADSFTLSEQAVSNHCWKESRGVADWVILTDIDEHLYHSDLLTLLIEYKAQGTTFVPALGYQMISEDFPSPSEMLCGTRTLGAPWKQMCKVSLFDPTAIEEINYGPGRHVATPAGNVRLPPRDELLLLHYKYLDFARTLARHQQLRAGLRTKDVANGWGHKYSWSEMQLKDDWRAFAKKAVDVREHARFPDTYYPFEGWWEHLRSRESKDSGE
jgi:glycosyltransferase involved in cell wall biosynthesis